MKIVSIEWLTDEITEQLNNEETCYLSSDKEYWLFTDDNVFNKISKEFHFDETIKNREYPIYSISVTEWLLGSWYDTLLSVVENIYGVELKEEI